jgi:hypothetical protein
MPDVATADYITKTEAARVYRRSERSISRDITNAIKFGDSRLLQYIELRLEDGTRRAGRELTIQEIVDLRDRGLNPTWLLQKAWLEKAYGTRNEPITETQTAERANEIAEHDAVPGQNKAGTPLPEHLPERLAVLAAQNDALERMNADLKSQTLRLEKELDRRADERREENQLQKQNNDLMQQVYDLLSKMQQTPGQINILNQGREFPAAIPEPSTSRERSTVVETNQMIGEQKSTGPQGKGTRPMKRAAAPKKNSLVKRPAERLKQPPKSSNGVERRPSDTAVSRYLPTLDRAVRSFFRK